MIRILILAPYAPCPPNSGGRMRIWEEIRYLGRRHRITLIAFYQSREEYEQRSMLDRYCERAILVKRPDTLREADLHRLRELTDIFQWYSTVEMKRALESVSNENFDVVVFEHIFMAQYRELFPDAAVVLQEHNIESSIFEQLARMCRGSEPRSSRQKTNAFRISRWMLMRKYENETWPRFPLRITVSQNDREEMDRRCSIGRTVVIENGINTRQVRPIAEHKRQSEYAPKILFMGSLDFHPNIDGLFYLKETILPILWQIDSMIPLVIAGRNPSQAILDFAADPRIEVIDSPGDIAAVAEDCCLTVVPMRIGSGTRIKILHSMALGLPVVSTTLGCEGLSVSNDDDILIRDTPEQFAEAVLSLLRDRGLASRLRTAGRKLVEDRYDWTFMFERLERELIVLLESSN